MTFDKAFETVDDNINYCDDNAFDQWYTLLEDLRKEYVPTVEMTHQQAKIFASYYHPEKPIIKDKFDYPDVLIMKDISEKELTQAWLHPDSIKIVDK